MRNSVYDRLYQWARRSTGFGDLGVSVPERAEAVITGDTLVYRLKRWPEMPAHLRKAPVFRALSIMSQRPVNRGWVARHAQMKPGQVEDLFHQLAVQDALHVIDTAGYPR